jgi:uncharacterized protein (DUF2225 family)
MKLHLECPHCFSIVKIENSWDKIYDIVQCPNCGLLAKLMYEEKEVPTDTTKEETEAITDIQGVWWLELIPPEN